MNAAKTKPNAKRNERRAVVSAQQTIPYVAMHPDGVCQLPGGIYTKTVEYEDINYAVASTEDQTAIFGGWSSFLNYFDSSLPFQLSFVNRRSRSANRYKVNIPEQEDEFNSIRHEYVEMLKGQIAKSNNGIERTKYITFGLPAGSVAEARPRLGRVEADVMGNLKRLGVQSQPLDGRDRLAVLHGQMHPGSREPFRFSWKDIPQHGMGTKDYIAPDSFDFRQSRTFRVGQSWGAASYLQILASELSDKLLAEILELDAELTVTLHIQTVDQLKAIKTIKGKISDIGRMKAEEQKKAVRAGYDMEILPPDLITFSKDAAELLADLQSRNERMFLLTFTVVNIAPTRQRLENDVFTVGGIAQKYNCALKRLDWQQEQGFVSSLVLGYNGIEIQRGMTTSSTAIFIPFMTRELRMDGQALYYGMNALSHNVIMADRKKLKSANGMYLGSTGSGKSFAAKRELINVFLATNDRIIVVDPMGEYAPLVQRLGGQVIDIAPDSPHHISPMDLQMNANDDESPLSMKADFLLSLCELIVGGREGLQPIEKTVIDRCVRLVYREMALGLETAKTPLLQDLYEELLKQPEPEARRVATALELYCTGSLNLFNHPTNVNLNSRVVCIVLKGLGENLRKIAMHTTNEFVTAAVNAKGYTDTIFFVDDGITGTTMKRPGFQKMIAAIEAGYISAVFVKDLSRLGRNYIEVGKLTEEFFPLHDVRLVAVSDGVDSDEGEDDFTPFKNIMNEYYAKDISKKRRIVNKMKGNAGIPLSPPPYGYIKNPDDPRFWVIDPEAAEVVRRIYRMALDGYGLAETAAALGADGIVNPTYYWRSRGTSRGGSKSTVEPTKWGHTTIKKILTTQEYCGDVINFKSYSKSYKMKRRIENPEENRGRMSRRI